MDGRQTSTMLRSSAIRAKANWIQNFAPVTQHHIHKQVEIPETAASTVHGSFEAVCFNYAALVGSGSFMLIHSFL